MRRVSACRCGRTHSGDLVRGVAQVSEVLAHKPVPAVGEDAAARGEI